MQDTDPLEPDGTGLADVYSEDAIDAATGDVLHQTPLGEVMYQGTVTGILRIASVKP